MTNEQLIDAAECEKMMNEGKEKECFGCSCSVCIANEPDHSKYLYKALKSAEQYMTEKGVSHEYPVMINARKALAEYERRNLNV